MKIGIIGASGVVGRNLHPRLVAAGHEVRAFGHRRLRTSGFPVEPLDILNIAALPAALDGLDVVFNLATSIPNGRGHGDWKVNDAIRTTGIDNLVTALLGQDRPVRLIQQSVAMLHQGKALSNEDSPLTGVHILASAVRMETTVQYGSVPWVIIRGGAVYGPGTARDAAFFARIAGGDFAAPEGATNWQSFIHIEDLAAAFAHAVTLPNGVALNAVDDVPVTAGALHSALAPAAIKAGAPPMPALPSFRVTNARLRATGWTPAHPDVLATIASWKMPDRAHRKEVA